MLDLRLGDLPPIWRVVMAQLLAADQMIDVTRILAQARQLRVFGGLLLLNGNEVMPLSRGHKKIKTVRYPQSC